MSRVMGIDLGTTNSVVAVVEVDQPEVVINAEGAKTTPSVIFYPPQGDPIVGELAKRQEIINPERTVRSIKRFMGCRWDESTEKRKGLQYQLTWTESSMVGVEMGERLLTPEEISAEILKKMRRAVEARCGATVDQAVITVPAYFNDAQRTATKAAAELAGLSVLRIINEPTAAALAYGLGKGTHERVVVFDLGGGTFDVSLLEIEDDVFEVRGTAGDNFLGGDNFDMLLAEWITTQIEAETGLSPREDTQARQRIHDTAEKIKCELSSLNETSINLPFIVADKTGPKHFTRTVKREEFEELIEPLIQRLIQPCKQVLRDSNTAPAQVDTILLVGGSTRIPRVQRLVTELFGKEPSKTVNPDEVVALGAAIQASILSGDIQEVLLLDVTPLSLGIELQGGLFKILIPRNSSIPTTASRTFTTTKDNQRAVTVHVLQGERKIAVENRSLGKFRLTGIRPAPKEVPEIEVAFHLDANGILSVSAQDLSTSARREVTIEAVGALSPEEIEKIISDSEMHSKEDSEFLRTIAERQSASVLRDKFQSFLDLHGDEVEKDDLLHMQELLMRINYALEANDAIALEELRTSVMESIQPYADLFYIHSLAKPDKEPEAPRAAAAATVTTQGALEVETLQDN